MQDRLYRSLPDLIVLAAFLVAQVAGARWLLRRHARDWSPWARRAVQAVTGFAVISGVFAFLLRSERVARHVPEWLPGWGRSIIIGWAMLAIVWALELLVFHIVERFLQRSNRELDGSRRQFLRTAQGALLAAPAAVLGYAVFIERKKFSIREQKLVFPDLPQDLDGLRMVQLTDIHMGPFLDRRDLEHAVAMANETRAHVALVTGDLITTGRDPVMECLEGLKGLRAEGGVFGCLGNHETYAEVEDIVEIEGARRGLRFLRKNHVQLPFGNAILNLAGFDYQRFGTRYLVGAEALAIPNTTTRETFNVMLSHNPDVFPVAAAKGFPLTIAGHTHGGQIRVEILRADLNVARFYTPYVDGLYRRGTSSIYVSRGIGTIGIPARLGAPPEVSLLHLCRA